MPPFDPELTEREGRRELLLAGLVVAAAVALVLLPVQVQQWMSSSLRSTVLAPFVLTQDVLQQARARTLELDEIQARLDSTTVLLAVQAPLREENLRLRSLLDLAERAGPSFVPAEAIRPGTRGSESMFLLDVGTRDGVSRDDPVISDRGLVGSIREVGPTTSQAMDWTHPDFQVGAMTLDGENFGLVEPRRGSFREEDRLLLNGIPFHTALPEGMEVVTSGLGVAYPRGIRIGRILSLAEAEAGWRRGYWLEPAVQPGQVTHVLVLTGESGRPESDWTYLWASELEVLRARQDTLRILEAEADSATVLRNRADSLFMEVERLRSAADALLPDTLDVLDPNTGVDPGPDAGNDDGDPDPQVEP
ncbi:MAG: rod shape-determining protein MreC [Gemmatimonadales bacterium]|nr:MAG: rod shape-determining protein MreC [Gemmatimonadales bacterium]